jgi:hypothetical protein
MERGYMKEVTYNIVGNKKVTVQYDENAPCRICELPVIEASMGGVDVCPWCDCGTYRDGSSWSVDEFWNVRLVKERAKKIYDKIKEEQSNGEEESYI